MTALALSSYATTSFLDWAKLKEDLPVWKEALAKETLQTLKTTAASKAPLASLNSLGIYHKTGSHAHGQSMIDEYTTKRYVPPAWIIKDPFPGIWCALFNRVNAYSFESKPFVLQFTFKADYFVFDPFSEEHQKMWATWQSVSGNLDKTNSWAETRSGLGPSLASRMAKGSFIGDICLYPAMPHHIAFYEENRFGAVIGYSEYISITIILPECVESVTKAD